MDLDYLLNHLSLDLINAGIKFRGAATLRTQGKRRYWERIRFPVTVTVY